MPLLCMLRLFTWNQKLKFMSEDMELYKQIAVEVSNQYGITLNNTEGNGNV